MSQDSKTSPVVGKNGFLYVDGVKIAKLIPERGVVQFVDPDRRRCIQKGREVVEVRISDLVNLPQQTKQK
jgi:hypothetical protein